jgi:ABC-type Fe3+-hydroxamate transport system substrate-binding protein
MAGDLRVITLTPHATEMVFAAGAGKQIVATVESSDYPQQAKVIARLGDGLNTSVEQVLAWSPDLVIGWPSPLLSQLESLGIRTLVSNPESLEELGKEVLRIGALLGTEAQAEHWHEQFVIQRSELMRTNNDSPRIKVVILASSDMQFVIGRHQLINDTLASCGVHNVFASASAPAPQVSTESLLAMQPDAMISGKLDSEPLQSPHTVLAATPLWLIDADTLYRPGPRFLSAAIEICNLARDAHTNR